MEAHLTLELEASLNRNRIKNVFNKEQYMFRMKQQCRAIKIVIVAQIDAENEKLCPSCRLCDYLVEGEMYTV